MKEPPKFNTDRSYERFETEIDAWSTITTVAPAKQGTLLMLSLPDNDRKFGDLKGKVMDGCDYKGTNGLKNVVTFSMNICTQKSEFCLFFSKTSLKLIINQAAIFFPK